MFFPTAFLLLLVFSPAAPRAVPVKSKLDCRLDKIVKLITPDASNVCHATAEDENVTKICSAAMFSSSMLCLRKPDDFTAALSHAKNWTGGGDGCDICAELKTLSSSVPSTLSCESQGKADEKTPCLLTQNVSRSIGGHDDRFCQDVCCRSEDGDPPDIYCRTLLVAWKGLRDSTDAVDVQITQQPEATKTSSSKKESDVEVTDVVAESAAGLKDVADATGNDEKKGDDQEEAVTKVKGDESKEQQVDKTVEVGGRHRGRLIDHMSGGVVDEDAVDGYGRFISYFFVLMVVCIVAYLVFHNKQKLVALVLEGRRTGGTSRRQERRSRSARYRKLDNNLEEAVGPNSNTSFSQVIY